MNAGRMMAVALAGLLVAADPQAHGQTTVVSLQQAIKNRLVEVEVVSLGGATGNTVRVNVRRLKPETVRINVTPGTVFLSGSDKQNMAGGTLKGEFTTGNTYRSTSVMVLADNAKHGYLIESFCLDYHRGAPKKGDSLRLAISDERARRIVRAGQQAQASAWSVQCAIWMDRMGVSAADLKKRFPRSVTDVEINVARKLVRDAEQQGVASVPANLTPEVRVQVQKLFSPDLAVRSKAVEVLVSMGQRAAPAVPFLASNVVNVQAEHHLPPNVVEVNVDVKDPLVLLEKSGIQGLGPWIQIIRDNVAAGEVKIDIKVGEKILVERFIKNLQEKNPRVRQRAAFILGMSKDPRAVEPLIAALKDGDTTVQDRAAEALVKITGQSFGKDQGKWRQWWKENQAEKPSPATKQEF